MSRSNWSNKERKERNRQADMKIHVVSLAVSILANRLKISRINKFETDRRENTNSQANININEKHLKKMFVF